MYRVHLSEEQRQELTHRTREHGLAARTRERLEMVRLSDAGWSVPRIARHFKRSEATVRTWLKRFLAGGFAALPDAPHLGQQSKLTPAILEAIRQELRQSPRTWSAPQVAAWLAEEHGVCRSPAHLGRMLNRAGITYRRTSRTLKHKQNPQAVESKRADLQTLEKGERPVGWISAM